MIRALIFDFDGLIVDTESAVFQAWQETYQAHGHSIPMDQWVGNIGTTDHHFDPFVHLETLVGHPLDVDMIRVTKRRREDELVLHAHVLPGVQEYLSLAKQRGFLLGVASSSTREWVRGHLSRLGLLGAFTCVKCRDDVRQVKPDPELYLLALKGLKADASETVAFEDSPHGIAAAKGAGIFCVAVPNPLTAALALDQADLKVSSLAELPFDQLLSEAGG